MSTDCDNEPTNGQRTASGLLMGVEGLSVSLWDSASGRRMRVLEDVSLTLQAGESLGVAGRSGGGKSTLGLALAGLLPDSALVEATRWTLWGADVLRGRSRLSGRQLNRRVRSIAGRRLFLISQDARSTLLPYHQAGWHLGKSAKNLRSPEAGHILQELGFDAPGDYLRRLPSQMSTGECQRIQLAMALQLSARLSSPGRPFVLLADEPFASVDGRLVGRLAEHLRRHVESHNALLLISHQLSLLRKVTDNLVVICNGTIAETGPTPSVLNVAKSPHPHTSLLLALERCSSYEHGAARLSVPPVRCMFDNACHLVDPELCVERVPAFRPCTAEEPLHQARCVLVPHGRSAATVRAEPTPPIRDAVPAKARQSPAEVVLVVGELQKALSGQRLRFPDLQLQSDERLGLLGPSGCGKTTLARILMGHVAFDSGSIHRFQNEEWSGPVAPGEQRRLWKRLHLTHQDADLAFDPGATIGDSLVAAYQAFDKRLPRRHAWDLAARLLGRFHLPGRLMLAPPAQLSGGERKRATIARSLAALGWFCGTNTPSLPRVLILDEPTVGIDVFLQGIIAAALAEAQQELGLAYLVISHDRRFVERFCDRRQEFPHLVR
jgi:ABC-type glutathione transport system ATPase component